MQNKRMSFYETVTQNIVGQIIAFILLGLWYGADVMHNLQLQAIFLVAALVRGYAIRRIFTHLNKKSVITSYVV